MSSATFGMALAYLFFVEVRLGMMPWIQSNHGRECDLRTQGAMRRMSGGTSGKLKLDQKLTVSANSLGRVFPSSRT